MIGESSNHGAEINKSARSNISGQGASEIKTARVVIGSIEITTSISEAYELFRILTQARCISPDGNVHKVHLIGETRGLS